MGIVLTPIITKDTIALSDLRGQAAEPDLGGIVQFLCEERMFSRERVGAALERTFRERSLW